MHTNIYIHTHTHTHTHIRTYVRVMYSIYPEFSQNDVLNWKKSQKYIQIEKYKIYNAQYYK